MLPSPCHTCPSVVGVGHDLPLCYKANLFQGHGVVEIRTVPAPKTGAASARCDQFSATEISCQYTTCSSPSTTYKLIHRRLYHPYRGICRTHASTFVSRFTALLRVLQSRLVKMTNCNAIRFFMRTRVTTCLGFTWFQYQMG